VTRIPTGDLGRHPTLLSRRECLALGLTGATGLIAQRVFAQSLSAVRELDIGQSPPGGLVVHNPRALDAEAPLRALTAAETAPEHFFVRSHFGPPTQIPLNWTLRVDGLVSRPLTLSLDEIRRLGAESHAVTLECAGNGRDLFQLPKTSGVQWDYGAVSTATWTGVPLRAVLERAGLAPSARHLWMEALDRAPLPTVPKFLRSLPRDVAVDAAFVAYAMNGRPIPLLHGGPLRLIMPGWFGMASTKWLTHVHAMPTESDNFFMAHGYRYADGSGVTVMQPKSVITTPGAEQRVPAGPITIRGQAWSGAGAGGIRSVEISVDGGHSWHPARLVGTEQSGAWRGWEAQAILRPGAALLMARATDRTGHTQPMRATPNPGGFGNNSIHQVPLHVG
jgi:DMSO/TMAO reductase YedYZ molybdopterin-dependent catalytic subunit